SELKSEGEKEKEKKPKNLPYSSYWSVKREDKEKTGYLDNAVQANT
ncbi:8339_t:CDS:1, partial [Gigaspora rosea]